MNIIKITWGTGWIVLDVPYIIEKMPVYEFKRWYELFKRYGTNEQYREFLDYLTPYLGTAEGEWGELRSKLELYKVRTGDQTSRKVAEFQRKLDGLARKVKRYKTMYEMVERLLS